jgi:Transglutaminase-like superfamily/TgpA N-terminal domain
MSATSLGVPGGYAAATQERSSDLRRLIAGPRQGWLALALLLVMLAVVGLALDDAAYVGSSPAGQSQTAWFPEVMVVGGLLGFVFAWSRLSTASSHLLGAGIGAALILVCAAGSISDAPSLLAQLQDLSASFARFVNDVFVLNSTSPETSAFLIVVGAIGWTTGYYGAFNVFRRSRAAPAVISAGSMLLVNMAVTPRPQFAYLVVFTFAAMLLTVRLNIVDQAIGWQRRHMGDVDDVSALFLRGGAVFVAATLLGAVLLAATASSAPLAGMWANVHDQLANLTTQFTRFAGGVTGPTRQFGGLFGDSQTVQATWSSSNELLFTSGSPDDSVDGSIYWRGATYDHFDGHTWTERDLQSQSVAAGDDLVDVTSEVLPDPPAGRHPVTAVITSINLSDPTLLAPDTPVSVNRSTSVWTSGGGPLAKIKLDQALDRDASYTVSSLVPDLGSDQDELTASQLAAAGTEYPAWVDERYLDIETNSIDPQVKATADQIVRRLHVDQRDPYHIASAIQAYFNSSQFHYSTEMRGVCTGEDIVDCLLTHKVGFCQYYASAMTMMLRTLDIPARYVEGYLPGKPEDDGTWDVAMNAAHAWVEVYFPGFGWLRFDPTPGNDDNGRQPTVLPVGTPIAVRPSPSATATESPAPEPSPTEPAVTTSVPPPVTPPADPGSIVPFAAVAVAAAGGVLLLMRRRRRVGVSDQLFDRVARLAARLGYGPHPSQTTYEYAGSLAEIVPRLRPELQLVANAKVETTYARGQAASGSLSAVHAAYGRIRRTLYMLFLRPRRPRPPRSSGGAGGEGMGQGDR